MPATLPEPPDTWNALPMATTTGWPLSSPQKPRWPALPVRSNDTIDSPAVCTVSDCVVSGTPTAVPPELTVDAPSGVHPPVAYTVPPVVSAAVISVPNPAFDDAVLFSRSFIAVVPTGVPTAVPGMPAVPVGVSAFSRMVIRALSIAGITAPRLRPRTLPVRSAARSPPRSRQGPVPAIRPAVLPVPSRSPALLPGAEQRDTVERSQRIEQVQR